MKRGSGLETIKKILFAVIRFIKYVIAIIVLTITIIFVFTFGVVWLGDMSGGFTP